MARPIPALVAFLLAACGAGPAGAPPSADVEPPSGRAVLCGPRAVVAGGLAAKYAERPVAMGLTADGLMLEVFAGADTFTILLTRPDGMACILAAGGAWQGVAVEKGEGA